MTKFLKIFLIATFIIAGAAPVALAVEKIGFVDLSRLFDDYYKTQEYDQQLEKQHSQFEQERNQKIEEIREAQGRLGLMADEERTRLEQEIEDKKAALLEFDRQRKTDLTRERNEKIREILLEIEKIVSDYAEKEGYSIILNDRVLIYGNQTYEVTEQILKILNQSQPSK